MQNRRPDARIHSAFCIHHSAFTLIELLVTLTIIVVLVALLVPMVMKSVKKAHVVRLQGDLQTISQALEAYRSDFGDYPRPAYGTVNGAADAGHPQMPTGAEMLCRALIAPAPAVDASTSPPIAAQDGADGPGFRLNTVTAGETTPQGRVYGPYLAADKFKVYSLYASSNSSLPVEAASSQTLAASGGTFYPLTAVIADIDGNPILYFPGRAVKPNITQPEFYVGLATSPPVALGITVTANGNTSTPPTQFSQFNADDNWYYMHFAFHDGIVTWRSGADSTEAGQATANNSYGSSQPDKSLGFQRICIMLGDYNPGASTPTTNCDGAIDAAGEQGVNVPFVLWCAGQDGKFGPDSTTPSGSDLTKLDDAMNIQ